MSIAAVTRAGLSALTLALLAACGGGGSGQIEPFKPTRMIAFGDEHSLLTDTGRRYSISTFKVDNTATPPTKTFDCGLNSIFTQSLARQFELILAQCNPENKPVTAFLRAAVGAKVAEVKAEIDAHFSGGGTVGPTDLFSIFVGYHDVLELYQQFPQQARAALLAEANARGRLLADQVNRLANANGRIVVLTVHSPGGSPYGLAQKAAHSDTDRAALMDELTSAFNDGLRLNLINDGRLIGLALAGDEITKVLRFASFYGVDNIVDAACKADVPLPNCTTDDLIDAAKDKNYLWADSLRLSPAGQGLIGQAAVARAVQNPF